MAERPFHILLVLLLLGSVTLPAQGQLLPAFGRDRAGTVGFQFLKIPVDARSASLGQTVIAGEMDASALFWNPALAAQATNLVVGLSHTAYFADITMQYAGVIYPVGPFVLGFSLQTLNSGKMEVTTEFEPFGTGETFSFIDLAAGVSLAQSLTDLFSYGVTAKWIRESVAGLNTQTVLFDMGFFYRVGETGIQMAVAIRNFGLDGRTEGSLTRLTLEGPETITDFDRITPPTTFLLGISYRMFRGLDNHQLTLSGQLINPNDNAENFNLGLEYTWHHTLVLRTGYRFGVEEYTLPSVGIGLYIPGLGPRVRFDYGFSRLERLGSIHRASLNLLL